MGNRYIFKTFKEWCLENNRQDILDLWDYNLNDSNPSEVPAGTKNRYFFVCPVGIHNSETRRISTITENPNHQLICLSCNNGVRGRVRKDLIGETFGELRVLGMDNEKIQKNRDAYWVCECSCGNIISVVGEKLKSGEKLMCGGKTRHKRIKENNDNEFVDIYDSKYLQELRQSSEYYQYRQEVMKKDGYKCVVCGSHDLEVHHIYPFATHPDNRLNPKTGICMCKVHHSVSSPISFHSIYGRYNNTPEQLEEYVNYMRQLLGIPDHFDVYKYMEDIESDDMDIDDYELDLYE